MIWGTPAMTYTFSILKPGAPLTGLSMSAAPAGMSAMLMRASLASTPRLAKYASRSVAASALRAKGTPKARATEAAVMSSWVGPTPPVVKT